MGTKLVLFAVLAVAGFFYLRWAWRARQRIVDQQRKLIDDAFKSRSITSTSPSLSFEPTEATLVHEQETVRGESAVLVQTTRVYRNASGEYFLFICSAGDKGFIKHLSRAEAMRALKPHKATFAAEFGPEVPSNKQP